MKAYEGVCSRPCAYLTRHHAMKAYGVRKVAPVLN
jgi:hypothetical protein